MDVSAFASGTLKFNGAAAAPNGLIVFVPKKVNGIGIFDAETNVFTYIDMYGLGGGLYDKYTYGALGPDGSVYFAPREADDVIRVDIDSCDGEALACGKGMYRVSCGVPVEMTSHSVLGAVAELAGGCTSCTNAIPGTTMYTVRS